MQILKIYLFIIYFTLFADSPKACKAYLGGFEILEKEIDEGENREVKKYRV